MSVRNNGAAPPEVRKALQEWASARGVTLDVLTGIGCRCARHRQHGFVLLWPYRFSDGTTAARMLALELPGGPDWRNEGKIKGAVMELGNLERAATVVIAEGESDALAAYRRLPSDAAVIGLPGSGMVGDDLANFIPNGAIVVIATDADGAGDGCAAKVAAALVGAGIDPVLVRRLRPIVEGVEAPDLRDLLEFLDFGVEEPEAEFVQLLREAPAAGKGQGGAESAESPTDPYRAYRAYRAVESEWPGPLAPAAFHGFAGEFVALVGPHTEADQAALLSQFLVEFGSVVGRGPHVLVGADRHGTNLAAVLVGATSRGRKGTSEGWVRALFEFVDDRWADHQVRTGLTSGEGLIHAVRDPSYKTDKDGQEVLSDPGEPDKRLTAVEPEFARVLRAAGRESNTLSAQLRLAWDAPRVMRTMTRTAPLIATEAHVSVVGHVTADELRRELNEIETANGFANRFLWIAVKRSKILPRGGSLRPADLEPLARRIANVVNWASTRGVLERDGGFWSLWEEKYPELTADRPGLLGAVTSRAEAQVLRLAVIYALLDSQEVVGRRHLEAALAVWRYCESSAEHVFGDATGSPVADKLREALRNSTNGMTRDEMRDYLGRHTSSQEITRALTLLERHGLAWCEREQTGGRPAERWYAVQKGGGAS
jgi:hypothetical protein